MRDARLLLIATVLVQVTCGSLDTSPSALAQTAPAGPGRAEDFMVVDCLLPGQMRQLGGQVTYVTARRAIKTSARTCQIRGGEYVAFDRANLDTSRKVWQQLADQGDPAAQTYLGEIYEKGLGVPPDYQAAAQWYRKAADKGFPRAAMNLGSLYEQGLGVPKDPVQALTWYRRGSGVKDLDFAIAPGAASTAPTSTAEVQQLRSEVEELRRQLGATRGELEKSQRELEQARRALEGRRGEVDAERGTVANLKTELDEARQRGTAGAARARELEQAIAERERAIATKDREMADLRATVTRLETDSKDKQARLERLRQQTGSTGAAPVIQVLEPELLAARDATTGLRAVTAADRLSVVGRVTAETELVSLTVNGREETRLANGVFKAQVPVAKPDERIRIVAVDKEGRRAALEFAVVRAEQRAAVASATAPRIGVPRPGATTFGTYHALVIGNNDYAGLRRLKTAANDAREVAKVLEKDYGYRVKLLLNANRYQMLSALNELREQLTEKDNLLIYYAGHGEVDEKNSRGYWLPVDAEQSSTANWISNIAISDVLNSMSVRQLLVVADSCYSGTMTRSALGKLEGGLSEEEQIKLMLTMSAKRSRMVMTSGGVEPVLDSTGGQHSAFAQAFLHVLRENVGVLPGQAMFGHLRLRVVSAAERVDMYQAPEYAPIKFAGHESGDFFFVRGN
ncbi:MAG: caspase family protein [Candidatus Rokuibacteriota bacterium]